MRVKRYKPTGISSESSNAMSIVMPVTRSRGEGSTGRWVTRLFVVEHGGNDPERSGSEVLITPHAYRR